MAFRDSWHRALVYFGLAEEYHDDYDEDDAAGGRARGPLPRAAERAPPAPPPRRVRRHLRRGRPPSAGAAARGGRGRSVTVLKPVGSRGNGDVRVHLVIPKSFNDAQQIADKFKDSIPVILNLQGSRHRPLQAPDRLRLRAHLRARRRHAADRRQGLHAHAAQRRDLRRGARAADREGLLQPSLRRDSLRLAASSIARVQSTLRSLRPCQT